MSSASSANEGSEDRGNGAPDDGSADEVAPRRSQRRVSRASNRTRHAKRARRGVKIRLAAPAGPSDARRTRMERTAAALAAAEQSSAAPADVAVDEAASMPAERRDGGGEADDSALSGAAMVASFFERARARLVGGAGRVGDGADDDAETCSDEDDSSIAASALSTDGSELGRANKELHAEFGSCSSESSESGSSDGRDGRDEVRQAPSAAKGSHTTAASSGDEAGGASSAPGASRRSRAARSSSSSPSGGAPSSASSSTLVLAGVDDYQDDAELAGVDDPEVRAELVRARAEAEELVREHEYRRAKAGDLWEGEAQAAADAAAEADADEGHAAESAALFKAARMQARRQEIIIARRLPAHTVALAKAVAGRSATDRRALLRPASDATHEAEMAAALARAQLRARQEAEGEAAVGPAVVVAGGGGVEQKVAAGVARREGNVEPFFQWRASKSNPWWLMSVE